MANFDNKMVEQEIRNFYESLEMNVDNIEKEVVYKADDGQEQKTTPLEEAINVLGQAIKRGRLVLNHEDVSATYTLRKPIDSLSCIHFTTENCTAAKVRDVNQQLRNAPNSWEAVILMTGGMLTKLQLDKVSAGEERILKYIAQLFLTY